MITVKLVLSVGTNKSRSHDDFIVRDTYDLEQGETCYDILESQHEDNYAELRMVVEPVAGNWLVATFKRSRQIGRGFTWFLTY
jgi:hypothetical protein